MTYQLTKLYSELNYVVTLFMIFSSFTEKLKIKSFVIKNIPEGMGNF